ncbi:MAG: NUDIX hydrolase [Planctomycetota bacterium]|nr:NUDIX hydrolase [Planctomycetota bacterium]
MTENETLLLTTTRFEVVDLPAISGQPTGKRRQIVRHPGAVTILPMVDHNHVCLIRNFRVSVNESLIELPAGTLEPDESPLSTAHRELMEETGYRAQQMQFIHQFLLSPGILDERMHLFVATDLNAGEPARESGEDISNLVVSWPQAIQWIFSGEIQDAKTITGLLMYDQIRKATVPS